MCAVSFEIHVIISWVCCLKIPMLKCDGVWVSSVWQYVDPPCVTVFAAPNVIVSPPHLVTVFGTPAPAPGDGIRKWGARDRWVHKSEACEVEVLLVQETLESLHDFCIMVSANQEHPLQERTWPGWLPASRTGGREGRCLSHLVCGTWFQHPERSWVWWLLGSCTGPSFRLLTILWWSLVPHSNSCEICYK